MRKQVLPRWIRFFSWVFLVFGPLSVLSGPLARLATSEPLQYMFMGVRHSGDPTDPTALIVQFMFVSFAVASYGLLWGRSWGLKAGLACGLGGLFVSLIATAQSLSDGQTPVPIEPIVQIAFIVSLWRRRERWEQAA